MIHFITREKVAGKQNAFLDGIFGTRAPEKLTFVETGELDSYDRCHIKGAVHLPAAKAGAIARDLLPNVGSHIVLYGEDEGDTSAHEVARLLENFGYSHLSVLCDGKLGWKAQGHDTVTSDVPADHQIPVEEKMPGNQPKTE
jgi:3-mercaptopyruvate sulfurtransferase SseA